LASFSVMFMALTRAAALAEGWAFASHTVLLVSGPLAQSGYWNPCAPLAAKAVASSHDKRGDVFMMMVGAQEMTRDQLERLFPSIPRGLALNKHIKVLCPSVSYVPILDRMP
jgi:hypothetical protein